MSIYLLLINALGFWIMHFDKQMARHGKRRVPEATLFTIATVGGSMGCFAGMYTFHHKTKHRSFTVGIPAILIAQLIFVHYVF